MGLAILRRPSAALAGRCTLALARVLATIDPARSIDLERQATERAAELAWRTVCGAPPSPLLRGEAPLLEAFATAQYLADRSCALLESNPPPAWAGRWSVSPDGLYETCPCVARASDGGFRAGLLVSYRGGDCMPGYGEPVPSLSEATGIERQRESEWHASYDSGC